mmetsp:Transcript_13141/g.22412  ORF Transcript_13141/g.22412 Transcript_13141/m.22412 type:complete len:122 (+) Transcript_13141:241-606(+)
MVGPCRHATGYAAEHNISDGIDDSNNSIISVKINTDVKDGSHACQHLQTIVASNDTNIILIKTQTILLHNHSLRGRNCHTGAAAALEAHAGLRTVIFAKITGLNAAAPAKHALAALVVAPS